MAVKLRLSRGGSKKRPFYKLVAADIRAPRDGKFLEKLGTYNPLLPHDHESRLTVDKERVDYWLGVGAKPTDRVARLLSKLDIIPAPARHDDPKKSAPGAKAQERVREREEKAKEAEEAAKAESEAPAEEASAEESAAE